MGAVSFAVGAEGSTYEKDGKQYQLTGWTLGAIAEQEKYLEERAKSALQQFKLQPNVMAQAAVALAEDIGCFAFSYGSEKWGKSLTTFAGLAHFAYQLMKPSHPELTLADVQKMVSDDPSGVDDAVTKADPRNRATAG
jgi:hypothetical protein